jgi:hypothetical protein
VAELVEGSRLLSGCGGKTSPRVRIPASPPEEVRSENEELRRAKEERMKKQILSVVLSLLCIFVAGACNKKEPEPPPPQIPAPMMPQGQMPQGQMPQGQMPQGQMPQGQMPQGQMPQGQMPQGQMPQGQMPQGQMPQGQMPQGQMPRPGVASMGKTQVIIPESVKGKWGAAKIILEDKVAKTKKEYEIKLNSDFPVPNSSLKIRIGDFLPDFRMDGLNLTSGSNEPRNPALSIRVYENDKQIFPAPGRQWGWLFAKVPSIHPFEHPKYGITLKEGVKKG